MRRRSPHEVVFLGMANPLNLLTILRHILNTSAIQRPMGSLVNDHAGVEANVPIWIFVELVPSEVDKAAFGGTAIPAARRQLLVYDVTNLLLHSSESPRILGFDQIQGFLGPYEERSVIRVIPVDITEDDPLVACLRALAESPSFNPHGYGTKYLSHVSLRPTSFSSHGVAVD